ncbi:Tautomerase PptA [Providencia manganoxydans]|uniref:tautomerase family protein n=1 Tax=Providencia manganoxydans TaxID=2923283 RepID=UPI003B9CC90F
MPHIIVKLAKGRKEAAKIALTEKILKAVTDTVNPDEDAVSIAIDEIESSAWEKDIYQLEIMKDEKRLYKKPRYKL